MSLPGVCSPLWSLLSPQSGRLGPEEEFKDVVKKLFFAKHDIKVKRAASYIFLKAETNNGEVADVIGAKCCRTKEKLNNVNQPTFIFMTHPQTSPLTKDQDEECVKRHHPEHVLL